MAYEPQAKNLLPIAPFHQEGIQIKCYYFKLKPLNHEQRLPEKVGGHQDKPAAENTEANTIASREEARPVQAVATDQGSLFS